jgi:hypothetical protein
MDVAGTQRAVEPGRSVEHEVDEVYRPEAVRDLIPYADALRQKVEAQISSVLTPQTTDRVASQTFRFHANSSRSLRFQRLRPRTPSMPAHPAW